MGKKKEMLTPRQFAGDHEVAYTTVMNWLRKGLIQGAIQVDNPFGDGYYWMIPVNAPKPELKPGPKPKPQPSEAKKGGKK